MLNDVEQFVGNNNLFFNDYRKEYEKERKDKDKINKKNKKYHDLNKDKIKEWRTTKIDCIICLSKYSISDKARHYKSQKHKEAEKNLNQN